MSERHKVLNFGPSTSDKNPEETFTIDLTNALVSSNIPLTKIEHPAFSSFLEKYTKRAMPSQKKMTELMEKESKEIIENIKVKLIDQHLFISMDESTDSVGRPICIVLAGPLDGEYLGRPYLIDLINLGSTNNRTVQQCVNSALFKLFGAELDYEKINLFVTDAAPYCVKAGHGLGTLYPNLIHVTCLEHGLNRVAELARDTYPKIDKLIGEVKKIFVKCTRRRVEFATACQIPLPPEPVLKS